MLISSSYRILPVNIPMVQLQHLCSTSTNRRVKILRTRSDQKQLYGEVIRDESKIINKQLTTDSTDNSDKLNSSEWSEINRSSSAQDSEFHWLVQRGHSPRSFVTRYSKFKDTSRSSKVVNQSVSSQQQQEQLKQKLPEDSKNRNDVQTYRTPTTTTNAKDVVISAKTLLQSFVTRKPSTNQPNRAASQQIPFDSDELNAIIKYPLVSNKCSLSQTIALTDKSMQIPSISKVLTATMPDGTRIALKKWKMAKIAELGADGFKQYEKETLGLGKEFHSAIEQYLSNGEVPTSQSSINQLWQSVNPSLNELKPRAVLMEQPILHADLKYKGIIDNVSLVKDELCAFEWKTSEKAKPRLTSTYDAPVQLCAYLGALNADPRYDLVVKNGRVVIAYKNGDRANVFDLSETDLRKYWRIWLQRLQEYWIRVKDGTLPDPI